MLYVFALITFLISHTSSAQNPSHTLKVIPLNSPVKADFAKFKIVPPQSIRVSRASYRIEAQTGEAGTSGIRYKTEGQPEIVLETLGDAFLAKLRVSEIDPGSYLFSLNVKPENLGANQDKGTNSGELHGQTQFKIDASLEVPDPGEKGQATLEGIDRDGDGIRDDIQRWINEAFADSARERAAMKQSAKYQQQRLVNSSVKEESIKASRLLLKASDCTDYIFGDKSFKFDRLLEAKMYNTEARLKASLKASRNFHGQIVHLLTEKNEIKRACEFDPDQLPN